MLENLKEDSYQEKIEKIEQGKSYLRLNGFYSSKSNLFEEIQKFIYKKNF